MHALLVTHGQLGEALLKSARQIYDADASVDVLSNDGRGAEELVAAVADWLCAHPGPALLMVDVGGGSCGIAARRAAASREECWILGGVNLAMLLTFLGNQGELEGEALVTKILDRALNAIDRLELES
jgi:mannose/fructose-specific phosphotransferase system component IIA